MKTTDFKKDKIPDIEYNNYKIILIGVSVYPEDKKVKNVPNIKNNIETLNSVLKNKQLVGIPNDNIFVSLNESKVNIEKQLSAFVKNTDENDTLFVYYTGHGFISSETFELFLATADSHLEDIESTGISIKRFRQIISQSFAERKIIILDACHSGGIHNHLSDNNSLVNSVLNKFEGEYVISSSSEDEPSLYPVGKKNLPTYFTGELVNVITSGINNGNPYITLSDIFKRINANLKAKKLPLPQQSNYNNAADLPVVKNILFNDQLSENDIKDIQTKYLHFANKSNTDVNNYTKKNVFFNVAVSITLVFAFVTIFVLNLNNNSTVVNSTISSQYEIISTRSIINNSYAFAETEPLTITNTDVNQLIEKAKVFMNADGGYDIALRTLREALSIDPDNSEVQLLIDSLEATQN